MRFFLKFIFLPFIYFKLFSISAASIFTLSVIVGCDPIYRGIKKEIKKRKSKKNR
jgi:hypothetical protein